MAYTETWARQDIRKLVDVTFLEGGLFCGDENSNLLGVEMYDGKEPYWISGECTAIAILSDETAQSAAGQVNGNKAFVVVPAEFLTTPGPIQIALRVEGATIGLFKGYVYRTATDDLAGNET